MLNEFRIQWKLALITIVLVISPILGMSEDCSGYAFTPHAHPSADTLMAWASWAKAHPNYHPPARKAIVAGGLHRVNQTCASTENDVASSSVEPGNSSAFDINLAPRSLDLPDDARSADSSGAPQAATESAYGYSGGIYPGGYGGVGGGGGGVGGNGGGPGIGGGGGGVGSTGGNGGDGGTGGTGGSGPGGPTEPGGPGGGVGGTGGGGGPVGPGGPGGGEPGGPGGGEPGGPGGPGGPTSPVAPTPEPSSLILLGTGLLGLVKLAAGRGKRG
jgi:hypothetical protein